MERFTGDEHFTYKGTPINRLLNNFQSWQSSNMLADLICGTLPKYIVATALGIDETCQMDDWRYFDVAYEGKTVNISSASCMQSWIHDKPADITFTIYKSKHGNSQLSNNGSTRGNADIFVFCLYVCESRTRIDPLQLEQWQFFVVPSSVIDEISLGDNQHKISLSVLDKLHPHKCDYDELRKTIDTVIRGDHQ